MPSDSASECDVQLQSALISDAQLQPALNAIEALKLPYCTDTVPVDKKSLLLFYGTNDGFGGYAFGSYIKSYQHHSQISNCRTKSIMIIQPSGLQ